MTDMKQLSIEIRPAIRGLVASHGIWAVLREALAAKLNANRAPPQRVLNPGDLSAHIRRDIGLD